MTGTDPAILRLVTAFARASTFASTVPLGASGDVPRIIRAAVAIGLTPVIAAHAGGAAAPPMSFAAAIAANAVVGLAFGLAAAAVAAAAGAAGGVVDAAMSSGSFDRGPQASGPGGPIARLMTLGFACVFFASGSMMRLCAKFVTASTALSIVPTAEHAIVLVRASMSASLAIAAPALCAQAFATIVAAFVARIAPRVNGLMLASPASTALVSFVLIATGPLMFGRLTALAVAASEAMRR